MSSLSQSQKTKLNNYLRSSNQRLTNFIEELMSEGQEGRGVEKGKAAASRSQNQLKELDQLLDDLQNDTLPKKDRKEKQPEQRQEESPDQNESESEASPEPIDPDPEPEPEPEPSSEPDKESDHTEPENPPPSDNLPSDDPSPSLQSANNLLDRFMSK